MEPLIILLTLHITRALLNKSFVLQIEKICSSSLSLFSSLSLSLSCSPTHLNGAALHHDEAVVHPAGGQHDQRLRPRRPQPERDGGRAPRVRQRQRSVRRSVEGG